MLYRVYKNETDIEKASFEANSDSNMTKSISDFKLPGHISWRVDTSEKSISMQN